MFELFVAFRQHLIWGLMLWVLLFTAFAALFARGQLIAFARGLARVLASIVVSPFVFIRKAAAGVLADSAEREAERRASDQYLLNKAMLLLQAIVIVAVIGALAGTGVVAWNTLVPPSEVRAAAREHRPKVEEQRQTAQRAASEVERLDAEWRSKEPVVVGTARKEQQTKIDAAGKQMATIEKDLGTYDHTAAGLATLDRIKSQAASADRDTRSDIDWAKNSLDRIIYADWYALSDWQRQLLGQWNEQWQSKTRAELRLASINPAELRTATQPTYEEAHRTSERAFDRVNEMEALQKELDEAASLKWKSAAWRVVTALAAIVLFIWLCGLVIEGAWLAVRVADDVRRLREAGDAPRDAAPAPRPGDPAPEPRRLPIRRPNEPLAETVT